MNDLGVARRVGDGRSRVLQLEQRLRSADLVEQTIATQLVGDRDRVDRLTRRGETAYGPVDVLMARLVEVIDVDAELANDIDHISRKQQGAQQALLGVEVVGRYASVGSARVAVASGVAGEISHG